MTTRDVLLHAQTTAGSRPEAERLAGEMVRRRLAACAQVMGPIRSVYWWQDAVQIDEEHLVVFKTREQVAERFKRELAELHPYDVPEIILVAIRDGAESYLDWIEQQTHTEPPER